MQESNMTYEDAKEISKFSTEEQLMIALGAIVGLSLRIDRLEHLLIKNTKDERQTHKAT
jgi:hypothetical protein